MFNTLTLKGTDKTLLVLTCLTSFCIEAAELKQFLKWMLTQGLSFNHALYYGTVPEDVRKRELALFDRMQ